MTLLYKFLFPYKNDAFDIKKSKCKDTYDIEKDDCEGKYLFIFTRKYWISISQQSRFHNLIFVRKITLFSAKNLSEEYLVLERKRERERGR